MSDEEAINLIFAPGFSTAGQVTDLSGRGVGMDIVRNTIERLGGRVSVLGSRSADDRALHLALHGDDDAGAHGGGRRAGLRRAPGAVVETIRVGRSAISPVGAARAMVLRDRTCRSSTLARPWETRPAHPKTHANVLIVAVAGQLGGLEVDRLGERMDVMLKPPEGLLAGIPGIDGTTLLGDGRVLIVLDLGDNLWNAAADKTLRWRPEFPASAVPVCGGIAGCY